MKLTVNGKEKELRESINIDEMLMQFNLDCAGIVIELNGKIVKKDKWKSFKLQENDTVEIISFVGGG